MSEYVLQNMPGSYCLHCNKKLHLLIEKFITSGDEHIFYICFHCDSVFQAGVGEVEKIEVREESYV